MNAFNYPVYFVPALSTTFLTAIQFLQYGVADEFFGPAVHTASLVSVRSIRRVRRVSLERAIEPEILLVKGGCSAGLRQAPLDWNLPRNESILTPSARDK